jgi:hypothetical protein
LTLCAFAGCPQFALQFVGFLILVHGGRSKRYVVDVTLIVGMELIKLAAECAKFIGD